MIDFENRKTPYLIAEIGINHNGDLQIAKKLIDAAYACEWDCVKFQKRTPDLCVPEAQKNVMKETPWGLMTYLEYKKRIEFGTREYAYIRTYCEEKPIQWSASVWDLRSLGFMMTAGVPFIKIPSACLSNIELLSEAAMTGIQLIVSTGMSEIEDIDRAVDTIQKYSSVPFVLMHCNSSYPTPIDELNLCVIPMFQERYRCVVGYSGHEVDLEPTVIAVTLGAKVIERHITLSHNMWGTDQKASLEVVGMDVLKKRVENIHTMLGSSCKIITKSEVEIMKKLRK